MSEPRSSLQPGWLAPLLAGVGLVVAVVSLVLANCWCDATRWEPRLALVALVVAVWLVELLVWPLPRLVLTLGMAGPVGWLIVTDNGSVTALYLLLLVAWVMYTSTLRAGLVATGLAILAVLGYVHFDSPDRWLPWILGISATALMIRLLVAQQALVGQLRAAQADLAQQAVIAERRRIAGEIHDVAAHSLAVTLLHLTGARLRVQREHGAAWLVDALAEAERLGRQSLDDVRRTVGLLQDGANGSAPPLPGARDLPALIEEFRAAGLPVSFELHGDPSAPTPATGLALYRIAQEALANVVKHAPGARVEVSLVLGPEVRLAVRNALPARVLATSDGGTGLGLGGMRERAQALGGTLRAGPEADGWLIECVLPVET